MKETCFLNELKLLSQQGSIRPIDYQFSRFIYSQLDDHKGEMALLASMLSIELGKGNVCLPLFDKNGQSQQLTFSAERLFELSPELVNQLGKVDWRHILQSSPVVSEDNGAVPMIFDGFRLYLQRYWHYEAALVDKLQQLSSPIEFASGDLTNLSTVLDQLFYRDYRYLFKALQQAKEHGSYSISMLQQLICDYLDVVHPEQVDWTAVEKVCQQASSENQLGELDKLVAKPLCVDWQKVAASVALTRNLTVISGGPGTGKTTTVTKLLLALAAQAEQKGRSLSIKLAAPTGKAAARLTESVGKALASIPFEANLKSSIPTESSTLHRLLGAIPNSVKFLHDKSNPLRLDVLVVDEASMVDLSMMYSVISALPPHARLILLGDKDQLSSVEAGSVLGDICQFLQYGYSSQQAKSIAILSNHQITGQAATPPAISDSLCMLQKSYRFDARSGVGQLAKAINTGLFQKVEDVYQKEFSDITHFSVNKANVNQLIRTLVSKYQAYLDCIQRSAEANNVAELAEQALKAFSRCRLLCALREGEFGVSGFNSKVEQGLEAKKLIHVRGELWYHGRPVMVTRNDHNLGLYNGDIGICVFDGERLRVFFELPDGSVKAFLPSRVPEHETAYAMTIHKSQGSEFDFVQMLLPKEYNPILTRELVYTGVTRARQFFELYSDKAVLRKAIKSKTVRASGLAAKLASL